MNAIYMKNDCVNSRGRLKLMEMFGEERSFVAKNGGGLQYYYL